MMRHFFWESSFGTIGILLAMLLGAASVGPAQDLPDADAELTPRQAMDVLERADRPSEFTPEQRKEVEALISQLGADSFADRQRATQLLQRSSSKAIPLVRKATQSPDPEVAWRAEQVLDVLKNKTDDPGIDIAPAVKVLVDAEEKQVIDKLMVLLGNDDEKIRSAAGFELRRITRQDFGFVADAAPEERSRAAERWAAWWTKAEPEYKFDPGHELVALVCDPQKNKVHAVNLRDHGVLWEREMPGSPMVALLLKGGNLLVGLNNPSRVVELDPKGEVVWELKGVALDGVFDLEVLPNGNLLVTSNGGGKVVEVTRDHKVVWEKAGLTHPHAACRLRNGNTVIAEHVKHRLLVVNPEGEIVVEIGGQKSITDVRLIEDGRYFFVLRMGNDPRVVVLDEHGKQQDIVADSRQATSVAWISRDRYLLNMQRGYAYDVRLQSDGTREAVKLVDTDAIFGKIRLARLIDAKAAAPTE
jgi:hypothetical protein